MKSDLALVAALDRDRAIGRGGALPWHLPADLRRFKQLTLGHPVLMGRRTAESIGKALPGRANLVLTRRARAPFAGQVAVSSLDEALHHAQGEALYVIGGGEVYGLTLPRATRLLLTWVDTVVPGADAFFPSFDANDWQITASTRHEADARHAFAFRFVDYERSPAAGG